MEGTASKLTADLDGIDTDSKKAAFLFSLTVSEIEEVKEALQLKAWREE